jgi:hypothetical protein
MLWQLSEEGENGHHSIFPLQPVPAGTEYYNEKRTTTFVHVPALNDMNWVLARAVVVEAGADDESSDSDSDPELDLDIGEDKPRGTQGQLRFHTLF